MGLEITQNKALYRIKTGTEGEIFERYLSTSGCPVPEALAKLGIVIKSRGTNYTTRDLILRGDRPLTFTQWIRIMHSTNPTLSVSDVYDSSIVDLLSDFKDTNPKNIQEVTYKSLSNWDATITTVLVEPETTIEKMPGNLNFY